jgi:hypothetical protein
VGETDALLARITADPEIFGGKPVVRGMRISVELIDTLADYGDEWLDKLGEKEQMRQRHARLHAKHLRVQRTENIVIERNDFYFRGVIELRHVDDPEQELTGVLVEGL